MNILKQSTAATIKLGPFVDDTDGKTAETALTIGQADIRLSKNGGDIAQTNNATGATHDELGYYDIPLDTTDTGTLGRLRVLVSKAGALPVWQDFLIVTANVFDTFCSTGSLNVNAASLSTDAITAASVKAEAVTKIQSGLATSANLQTVDDNVDAIKAKTDNLPASPAAVGSAMTLTAAYDKAKDDVLTPLAVVDALIDTLITRLTETRAGNLDKLAVGAGNTLAHTGNANTFKADVSALALEATLTAMKGQGFAQDAGDLASIYDKLYTTFGNTNLNQLKDQLNDIKGAGWTVDDNLKNIWAAAASANYFAEDAAEWGRVIANPTTGELFAARDAILAAIDDKPVTPVTDTSELATKLDLDVLAKAANLDELLAMLTTVANDTGTAVPQLIASLPAKVWSYPFRTLTVSAIRPQTLLEGDQFSIYKDTSILIPITALGDISAYDNLWFTAKKEMDLQDGDEKAIIHIDLLTGLLYINQEVADNALGGIRVDDSEAGNIDIWLSKNASALLPLFSKETLRWEVKGISGDNVDILLQGTNYILPAVTRKIS